MAVADEHRSWMLACLERDTHDLHEAGDRDLFRVLDEPTLAGYRRFLATVYHFEYAVEAKLVYVSDLQIRFLATRLRTGPLGDDLFAVGFDARMRDIFAMPIDTPAIENAEAGLAWIYVLQRNTLHHTALYRALAPRLRSTLQHASRYLTAYAGNVHQRWHELGLQLDHVATTPEAARRIVDIARDGFARQHRWYREAAATGSIEVALGRS